MIFEKIREIICEQFELDEDKVTLESRFVEDFDADSLDVVELTMGIEEAFDLDEIDEDQLQNIKTVGDLVKIVEGLTGK